ncbi:hypothetical protein [Barrientosiimonas endolithica]|nr:hypothetical protein [Barrientosiimonas endolithica]
MDLTPYVDLLRRDLSSAAEVGGDQGREAARTLLVALEPAARLALMEAVAQAAAEISSELPAGSVEVRLAGRDLDFVVDAPPTVPEPPAAPAPPGPPGRPTTAPWRASRCACPSRSRSAPKTSPETPASR